MRKTETQLDGYGIDAHACDECEWFDGVTPLLIELCTYHQGFVDGFDFARTIPPAQMPSPTTIKVVAGIPQQNEEKEPNG